MERIILNASKLLPRAMAGDPAASDLLTIAGIYAVKKK